jgi:membrane-bound ClpP family serine protease
MMRFEDALKIARLLGSNEFRSLKVVSFVESELKDHRQLIVLASEQLLVTSGGSMGTIEDPSISGDETISQSYQLIAQRRGLVSRPVVVSILDLSTELVQITSVDGKQSMASGETLKQERESGTILKEEVWKRSGQLLTLSPERLREIRATAGTIDSIEEAADILDIAQWVSQDSSGILAEPQGSLIELEGSISRNRVRRWQSNLNASLESGNTNTWIVSIDSSGGDLKSSSSLAASFALFQPPLQMVAGMIHDEARGDAALLALACRPLYMSPNATLGGPGQDAMQPTDITQNEELIREIAKATNRPLALMRGILDPTLEVYRYTDRRTGRIRYATPDEIAETTPEEAGDADAPEVESRWQREQRIELAQGLTPAVAIELGLVDAEVDSVEGAAKLVGFAELPPPIVDRPFIRWIERIGSNNKLMFFLLMIGIFALSTEASAPGVGVPGFVALICLSLYVWMKFLAGTAEWLELIAFCLGITCLAIEVFVLPGFGIFGIGGLLLTMLGIVLMSQTFVVPRNTYQLDVLTHGIWVALGSMIGLIGGMLLIRSLVPHVPMLNSLVMETDDPEAMDRHERLVDYGYLMNQVGIATTPLLPAGKVQFGDSIVAVVSDGVAVESGQSVRVREVQGNRIVVELVSS